MVFLHASIASTSIITRARSFVSRPKEERRSGYNPRWMIQAHNQWKYYDEGDVNGHIVFLTDWAKPKSVGRVGMCSPKSEKGLWKRKGPKSRLVRGIGMQYIASIFYFIYCPRGTFMEASGGYLPSYTWKTWYVREMSLKKKQDRWWEIVRKSKSRG